MHEGWYADNMGEKCAQPLFMLIKELAAARRRFFIKGAPLPNQSEDDMPGQPAQQIELPLSKPTPSYEQARVKGPILFWRTNVATISQKVRS